MVRIAYLLDWQFTFSAQKIWSFRALIISLSSFNILVLLQASDPCGCLRRSKVTSSMAPARNSKSKWSCWRFDILNIFTRDLWLPILIIIILAVDATVDPSRHFTSASALSIVLVEILWIQGSCLCFESQFWLNLSLIRRKLANLDQSRVLRLIVLAGTTASSTLSLIVEGCSVQLAWLLGWIVSNGFIWGDFRLLNSG